MVAYNHKLFILSILLFSLIFFGCGSSSSPSPYIDENESVKNLKLVIDQQGEKIYIIEKQLEEYKKLINDQSQVLDIYDDNNKNVIDFRRKLEKEVQIVLEGIDSKAFEQEISKTMIKIQNKINILEDRTFFTDSLYFEIINELVMIENKIESLIASYKEMSAISDKKKTRIIPKITDEEYNAQYIEALSNYQNAEWNMSLDAFKFLIQADTNHDLADNCQYWIGEVYYSMKDFKRSINEFEKVFTFPGTNKADDAQFKLGLCYVNLGQIDKAKLEFEGLLEFYPNSEYYKRSQEYLNKY